LGLHSKPIYLLNIDGYWNKLTDLIAHLVAENFASESLKDHFSTVESVDQLMVALRKASARR
jgi:predicted Rossmann-fold nucleotide-binding protein